VLEFGFREYCSHCQIECPPPLLGGLHFPVFVFAAELCVLAVHPEKSKNKESFST